MQKILILSLFVLMSFIMVIENSNVFGSEDIDVSISKIEFMIKLD
jgi:hypothetical protein